MNQPRVVDATGATARKPEVNRFDCMEEVVRAALECASGSPHPNTCALKSSGRSDRRCDCHVGKAQFALSFWTEAKDGRQYFHGYPTTEETSAAIGNKKWVLTRRTPRSERQYGEDATFLTHSAYEAAQRRAVAQRAARMNVACDFAGGTKAKVRL